MDGYDLIILIEDAISLNANPDLDEALKEIESGVKNIMGELDKKFYDIEEKLNCFDINSLDNIPEAKDIAYEGRRLLL